MITAKQLGRTERAFGWVDLAVAGLLVGLIYAMVMVAHEWSQLLSFCDLCVSFPGFGLVDNPAESSISVSCIGHCFKQ